MDRIINFKVTSSHLIKDSNSAGVRGEANSTILRIKFDESWDGYAKTVVFRDAKGENPVKRVLTVDLIENIAEDPRVYLCPIPAEPLAYEGKCEISIDGYVGGKKIKSHSTFMTVWHSESNDNAGEAADPTPTQAEQLQVQIDSVLSKIQRAIEVSDTADTAKNTALAAQNAAEAAAAAAERAEAAMSTGSHASRHAAGGDDVITPAMIGAMADSDTSRPKYMGMDFTNDLNKFYGYRSGTFTTATTANVPDANVPFYDVWQTSASGRFFTQYASVVNENRTFMRKHYDGSWTAWTEVLHSNISPEKIYAAAANSIYNIDEIHPSGIYRVAGNGGTFPIGSENGIGTLINILWDGNYVDQIFLSYHTFRMHRRRRSGGIWEPWYIINDGFTFTKSTVDIGEGAAMAPDTWYAVYE